MSEIKMIKAVALNNTSVEDLSEEVIDYVSRVINIADMDEQFWADFILGTSLWGITAGYTGAI